MKLIFATLAAMLFVLFSPCVLASLLSISPVLLTLTNEEPICTLTLSNASEESVTVQADVYNWQQKEGSDIYRPANEMLISPPLFTLNPHQSQLLRVAWLNKHKNIRQLTYRVILREIVPRHLMIKSAGQEKLQIALAFSIPLFIQPQSSQAAFQWQAYKLGKKKLKLSLINQGNITLFVDQIQILSRKKIFQTKTFVYVLPGQRHVWLLNVDGGDVTNIAAMINREWKIKRVRIKT